MLRRRRVLALIGLIVRWLLGPNLAYWSQIDQVQLDALLDRVEL